MIITIEHDDELDGLWIFTARLDGVRAGRLTSNPRDDGVFLLADLVVEDEVIKPPCCLPVELLRMVVKPKKRNLRGQGVGRALMKAFLDAAKAKGATRTFGSVNRDDAERAPHLLDWYRRLGFSILEPDDECIKNAAWKIEMKFGSA